MPENLDIMVWSSKGGNPFRGDDICPSGHNTISGLGGGAGGALPLTRP
jgi:hypothetical protein